MQIIKNGKIIDDPIRHLADDEVPADQACTVSLERWLTEKDTLAAEGVVGVRLHVESKLVDIAADLPKLKLVVVEFPALADGRGFSIARLLRERYAYHGEVRAKGDFIRDQVYFLARVGVNAFEPAEGTRLGALLPALNDFSVNYQAAADGQQPIYRMRG